MAVAVRALIASHVIIFGAGFYLGRSVDAEELNVYREAHESIISRLRRQAGTVVMGSLVLGTLVVAMRLATPRRDQVKEG